MNIAVVILHYLTEDDTMRCIDSFRRRLDTEDYKIVIVDNKSTNGSADILEKKYESAEDIVLIRNEENLGFARGLNTGIRYARKVFAAEFILAVNNDTELMSEKLYDVLKRKYEEYKFALMGPMIVCGDGVCTINPITDRLRGYIEIQKSINRYKKWLKLNKMGILNLYFKMAELEKIILKRKKKELELNERTNVKLHGSFWIFSQEYFTKFEQLDEGTFLYMEEDILFLHLMKNNLLSLYSPEVIVYHKEDSSTGKQFQNTREKNDFVYKNCIDSQKYYLKLWDKYNT